VKRARNSKTKSLKFIARDYGIYFTLRAVLEGKTNNRISGQLDISAAMDSCWGGLTQDSCGIIYSTGRGVEETTGRRDERSNSEEKYFP